MFFIDTGEYPMDCLREACRNIRDDWSECPGFTPAIPCRGDRSCIGGCRGATSFSAHAGLVRSASNNLQYRTIFTRESQARQSFLDACNTASLPLYSNDRGRRADVRKRYRMENCRDREIRRQAIASARFFGPARTSGVNNAQAATHLLSGEADNRRARALVTTTHVYRQIVPLPWQADCTIKFSPT